MTPAPRLPLHRAPVFVLAIASAALVATAGWRHFHWPTVALTGSPLEDLQRQAQSLRSFDDARATRARSRSTELLGLLWTAERFEVWKRSVPEHWSIQEAAPRLNTLTVTRRIVLTRSDGGARDWPEIYRFFEAMDALPAAALDSLTVSMPSQSRRFETVRLIVDLAFSREEPDAASAAEAEGGPRK